MTKICIDCNEYYGLIIEVKNDNKHITIKEIKKVNKCIPIVYIPKSWNEFTIYFR